VRFIFSDDVKFPVGFNKVTLWLLLLLHLVKKLSLQKHCKQLHEKVQVFSAATFWLLFEVD
jgi:hypothetical protein